ncbi:WXG100 family type VII secretion target [Corynebacterium sp. 13CS0277]|uniref:WXG100 family type VII secretion target n=1 Tax=Corynebacterium sp. 13CS0277 TaxID=2071994 RepID=UPI000D03D51A|nr:WXG100 family type VII secretion target [Corynebacterium sp. 13CS0277]PRQ11581.1 WXG100 family type VII secretion target [Corynebacterium sp. 13CS0277]
MNSAIKYQFGAITAASGDIQQTSGRINGLLDELKAQIKPMVATWEGDSASAYQAAQLKWDNAAAELNNILATIANTVQEGNDRMSDINRRAAGTWAN